MIAVELGATVAPGTFPETGFHTVTLADNAPFDLPGQFAAFMWHRTVFSLPEGAEALGGSAAAPLQGFAWDTGRVVGLLCHLEATRESVATLLESQTSPAGHGDYLQSAEAMLATPEYFDRLAPLLDRLLSQWLRLAT